MATDDSGRVTVTNILDSSDAYRRGLRYGDEIVSFAGRPIASARQSGRLCAAPLALAAHRLPLRRDGVAAGRSIDQYRSDPRSPPT